jgi:outer membrane protein insertion porin family
LRLTSFFVLAILTFCAASQPVPAQAETGSSATVVRAIEVEGNNRIEIETVVSYLVIKVGDPFDSARMDQSLKSLFATGLFSDVTLRREGGTLIVRVVENPIINRVAFEGNNKVDDDTLTTEVQLRPRVVYTRTRVQTDVKRILEIYRASGRFAATVDPKVIALPQNRVDLVFEINEGDVTGIRRISFIGNRVFSDSKLRSAIQTRESEWWRFLSTDDTYDPDRVEFDKELLRKFYLKNGYADFRVVSAVAELTPDRKDFFVTFTLEEGERYKFGKIGITTSIRNLDTEQFLEELRTSEGDWYNADLIEQTINKLTDAAGTLGYAFVEVRPKVERVAGERRIDLTFEIREGPRVFVERIEIRGNDRTRDEVIRREMRLAEGDAFNTAKIRLSRRRIRRLGFFEKIEVNNAPGSTPDRTVVQVEVEERATGQLSLGAGFSSDEGVLGNFSIQETNFLGRGQKVGLTVTLSQRTQEIDASITEPYFLGKNLSAGLDLFRRTRDFDDESSFRQGSTGGRIRFGYEIEEFLMQEWKYTLKSDSVENVDAGASIVVRNEEGSTLRSMVGQTLTYDRRDDRLDPTGGYFGQVGTDFAGLGGSERFARVKLKGAVYYSPILDITFSVLGEAGHIVGVGRDVGLADRFFRGGENFRGFKVGGIGPRDKVTDDGLGANTYYTGTFEVAFPLGLPKELGIRGRAFVDAGSAFGIDVSNPVIVDTRSLRVSVGGGLSWKSPFGPIRADIALAVLKEDFDETQRLHFNFGTRF